MAQSVQFDLECFNTWAREEPNKKSGAKAKTVEPFQYLGSRGAQLQLAQNTGYVFRRFNTWAREEPNNKSCSIR